MPDTDTSATHPDDRPTDETLTLRVGLHTAAERAAIYKLMTDKALRRENVVQLKEPYRILRGLRELWAEADNETDKDFINEVIRIWTQEIAIAIEDAIYDLAEYCRQTDSDKGCELYDWLRAQAIARRD